MKHIKIITEELVKLLYEYYEHGAETHTIVPYEDAKIFIDKIGLPVEAQVSDDCERKFTLEEILQLIREEITETYEDDLTAEELKDKIYTIHGFVICALSRKQASNSR